jgi:hypothetical protein
MAGEGHMADNAKTARHIVENFGFVAAERMQNATASGTAAMRAKRRSVLDDLPRQRPR